MGGNGELHGFSLKGPRPEILQALGCQWWTGRAPQGTVGSLGAVARVGGGIPWLRRLPCVMLCRYLSDMTSKSLKLDFSYFS